MLHPKQFEVNEAWIAFRINSSPVRTELDGDFNCIALIDAASCFILAFEFVSTSAPEPTPAQFRQLMNNAKKHKQQLPRTLFIARADLADIMTHEATKLGVAVVRVPDNELLLFITEARQGFAERFEPAPR
jgi:hypothetical protein